jgi:hypothetical protein
VEEAIIMIKAEIISRMLAGLIPKTNMTPLRSRIIPSIIMKLPGIQLKTKNIQKHAAINKSRRPSNLINMGFLK